MQNLLSAYKGSYSDANKPCNPSGSIMANAVNGSNFYPEIISTQGKWNTADEAKLKAQILHYGSQKLFTKFLSNIRPQSVTLGTETTHSPIQGFARNQVTKLIPCSQYWRSGKQFRSVLLLGAKRRHTMIHLLYDAASKQAVTNEKEGWANECRQQCKHHSKKPKNNPEPIKVLVERQCGNEEVSEVQQGF